MGNREITEYSGATALIKAAIEALNAGDIERANALGVIASARATAEQTKKLEELGLEEAIGHVSWNLEEIKKKMPS